MRELRTMLDEEQKARADGKRLELSIMVLGTAQDDLRFGVDLRPARRREAGRCDLHRTGLRSHARTTTTCRC